MRLGYRENPTENPTVVGEMHGNTLAATWRRSSEQRYSRQSPASFTSYQPPTTVGFWVGFSHRLRAPVDDHDGLLE
jgi:hypothetical protein